VLAFKDTNLLFDDNINKGGKPKQYLII